MRTNLLITFAPWAEKVLYLTLPVYENNNYAKGVLVAGRVSAADVGQYPVCGPAHDMVPHTGQTTACTAGFCIRHGMDGAVLASGDGSGSGILPGGR